MNVDLKSAAIGGLLVGAAWLASYGTMTQPAMRTLVREKAELSWHLHDAMKASSHWQEQDARDGDQMGACYRELQAVKDAHRQSAAAQPPAGDDQAITIVGNLVHPGLGTGIVLGKKIVQKNQAGQCPSGSQPTTDPNWQGTKCVEAVPQ